MNAYCTMTDINYLIKVLTMYYSIMKTGENFLLYIVSFDDKSDDLLRRMSLKNVIVISVKEIENDRILKIKEKCSISQYCWACVPAEIDYILDNYEKEEITYIDGDLFFFSKPSKLLDEFHETGMDTMLTPHNYTPGKIIESSGEFCVQFMPFRNNKTGRNFLSWWREECEQSYLYPREGQMGEQRCLSDAVKRFKNVYVMQNAYGAVAPWNVEQYEVTEGPRVNGDPVVFYHFHGVKWLGDKRYGMDALFIYHISKEVERYIYKPYIESLCKTLDAIRETVGNDFNNGVFELESHPRMVFFGAGKYGHEVIDCMRDYDMSGEIVAFCDNSKDKQGETINGIPVISVEDAAETYKDAYFWIQGKDTENMRSQLLSLGVSHIMEKDLIRVRKI